MNLQMGCETIWEAKLLVACIVGIIYLIYHHWKNK